MAVCNHPHRPQLSLILRSMARLVTLQGVERRDLSRTTDQGRFGRREGMSRVDRDLRSQTPPPSSPPP
ncbi:hypothetical protein I352_04264 [Cryptococcus deuterogattii MMRL2647]|nr:hypothetical protein I352_04264 [Cryptococcus deuterogattii MMRL2647]